MVKHVLIFESNAFSLEPTIGAGGRPSDLPLGLDLAADLRDRLRALDLGAEIPNPVDEDFGSVLPVYHAGNAFKLTITWVPVGGREDCWAIQFHQAHGCLGTLVGRRPNAAALHALRSSVDKIVRADPERFRNPRWLTDEEFQQAI